MKVFVATSKTQGRRKNDFCHATEGELVFFPVECDGERVDGRCGCRRSMTGLESHAATTTIEVSERDMTPEEYSERILKAQEEAGFGPVDDEMREDCQPLIDEIVKIAARYAVGTVFERRGDQMGIRQSPK